MSEPYENLSEEIVEENLDTPEMDVEEVTEDVLVDVEEGDELSDAPEVDDDNEEVVVEEEASAETGQRKNSETDPEFMVRRLKRQRKSINREHEATTQALRDKVAHMEAIFSIHKQEQQPHQAMAQPTFEDVDMSNPVAVQQAVKVAANAVLDERITTMEKDEHHQIEQQKANYVQETRLSFAMELQTLAEASESGIDPCIQKLDPTMIDNAMRLSNGAQVLRAMCTGKEWERVKYLPEFEQAREMEKWSRKISSKTNKKTKSAAPPPIAQPRGRGVPSLSKSPNNMSAQDYKAAMREGRL